MLWQRKGVTLNTFLNMSPREQACYIASESIELESPVTSGGRFEKAMLKSTKGGELVGK